MCIVIVCNVFIPFEVREDDVWVTSFPKCGTTWTQVILANQYKAIVQLYSFVKEMVWNIMHGVDLEEAKATNLEKRVTIFILNIWFHLEFFSDQVPFLELSGILEDQFSEYTDSFTRFACTILALKFVCYLAFFDNIQKLFDVRIYLMS